MSIPPPPPSFGEPPRSKALIWLIGVLGVLIVAGLAVVIVLLLGERDGGDAAPTAGRTVATGAEAADGLDGATADPGIDPAPAPGPEPAPEPEPAPDPDPEPPAVEGTIDEVIDIPIEGLLAACIQEDPAGPLPTNARDHTTMYTDFDGDGSAEELGVYRHPDEGRWVVRVDTDFGYAAELPVADAWGSMETDRIVTFGEDRLAMFRSTQFGDPARFSFYLYRDCRIQAVPVGEEGAPFVGRMLPVIAPDIPQLIGGFRCSADSITVTEAHHNETGTYSHTIWSQTFTWDSEGGRFLAGPEIALAACCTWPEDRDLIESAGVRDCPGGIRGPSR